MWLFLGPAVSHLHPSALLYGLSRLARVIHDRNALNCTLRSTFRARCKESVRAWVRLVASRPWVLGRDSEASTALARLSHNALLREVCIRVETLMQLPADLSMSDVVEPCLFEHVEGGRRTVLPVSLSIEEVLWDGQAPQATKYHYVC